MAGESENIGKISAKVSAELFIPFGWDVVGGPNFNFPCHDIQKHGKTKNPQHPCDDIFTYVDPYTRKRIYLLTDLKSYKRETLLDKAKIKNALFELAKSVSCGLKSPEFQENFYDGQTWDLHGLLFAYNHDGRFDRDFSKFLHENSQKELGLPITSMVYNIGPEDIQFYYDVLNDLERDLGKDNVKGRLKFFYPNQIERIPIKNHYESATIQQLKGRFMTVTYQKATSAGARKIANLYYRGSGESHEEFEYFLDYCFRYSLLDDDTSLCIKLPYPHERYKNNFQKACISFLQHFYKSDQAVEKIQQISIERVVQTSIHYSEYEIGLEARKEFSR